MEGEGEKRESVLGDLVIDEDSLEIQGGEKHEKRITTSFRFGAKRLKRNGAKCNLSRHD